MTRALSASAEIVLIVTFQGCNRTSDRVYADFEEKKMEAAIAQARSEMGRFIDDMENGRGSLFSVKVRITDR